MCGIALIVGPNPDRTVFEWMLGGIAPRGEARETLSDDRHLLGTQRLKIVDRERAIQPWGSPDGRWAVCYNGEVYNFRSLRSELAALGHVLRSDSDTEVVLEAFLEWGEGAVRRLRGEFAFAIADRTTEQVYLARDSQRNNERVALKVLAPLWGEAQEARLRCRLYQDYLSRHL